MSEARAAESTTMHPPLTTRLEPHKRWLVQAGDELGKKAREHEHWKSQIRTLLEAARHETEPLVISNLLGYQATREKKWKWNDLDQALRTELANCDDRSGDDPELAMEMIRHLLLYFMRAYTYHEAAQGEKGDREGEGPGGSTS